MTCARLEPITQRFIDDLMAVGGPPVYTLSPTDARALLARQQSVPTAKPDAHIEDATFPVGPKGAVRVRIVRPKDSERLVPVIMHFHGGGWVLGDVNTHDRLIREIAVGAHAAVVFVDYDRAPEAQFPIPLEEAYAATKYVAENGSNLNVDSSRLAVVGDSAGGNIAAAVTLLCKERRGPKISFQLLFYPVTDANFETGSYTQFQDGPWNTKAGWSGSGMLIYRTRPPGEQSSLRRLPQRLINSRACLMLSSSPPRTMYSETRGRPTRESSGKPACASPAPATSVRSTIS